MLAVAARRATLDLIQTAYHWLSSLPRSEQLRDPSGLDAHRRAESYAATPAVSRIKAADLRDVLIKGLDDFAAYRTDEP
jgi:hypothetical protein